MATKLKNLRLTSVDLVREGANPKADICIFKSSPNQEIQNRAEKGGGSWWSRFKRKERDKGAIGAAGFLEAITASMESIIQDDRLTKEEKIALAQRSLEEYHEKMLEAVKEGERDDAGDDIEEIEEI